MKGPSPFGGNDACRTGHSHGFELFTHIPNGRLLRSHAKSSASLRAMPPAETPGGAPDCVAADPWPPAWETPGDAPDCAPADMPLLQQTWLQLPVRQHPLQPHCLQIPGPFLKPCMHRQQHRPPWPTMLSHMQAHPILNGSVGTSPSLSRFGALSAAEELAMAPGLKGAQAGGCQRLPQPRVTDTIAAIAAIAAISGSPQRCMAACSIIT